MPDIKLNFSLWLPLIAFVLGAIAHALTADGGRSLQERFGLPAMPRSWLPYLTIVFGVGADAVNMLVLGKDWQEALTAALFAAASAVFGLSTTRIAHDKAGGGGGNAAGVVLFVAAMGLTPLLQGCSLFSSQNLPTTLIDAGKVACIIEHAFVDDLTLNTVCSLVSAEERAAAKDIAAAHRTKVASELKAMRAESCSDGGAK